MAYWTRDVQSGDGLKAARSGSATVGASLESARLGCAISGKLEVQSKEVSGSHVTVSSLDIVINI